jgi:hypothetical protein
VASAPAGPTETLTVSNAAPANSHTQLDASHTYQITATGTASYWCTSNDPNSCTWPALAHPNVELAGTDAIWCYANWRCPNPLAWRPLLINGKGLDQLAGLEGGVPYDSSHSYTV